MEIAWRLRRDSPRYIEIRDSTRRPIGPSLCYCFRTLTVAFCSRPSVGPSRVYQSSRLVRVSELSETGCDTVAVGCPFCSIMVKDGLDSIGAEMDVKDVAEILWEQIVAKDNEIQEKVSNVN